MFTDTRGAVMTRDDIRRVAPSVFATHKHESRSDRYRFIPTSEVLDVLQSKGFLPVRASQSKPRDSDKREFTRHMIRFRPADSYNFAVGSEIPELVLTNAHDGTGAYRFMFGLFRLVCSNGLIVQSADFGSVSVHHKGGSDFAERVIDATYEVMDNAPRVLEKVNTFKQIETSMPDRLALAKAALEIKPINGANPHDLLMPQRRDDKSPDLFTVQNVIQEHLMRGGIRGRSESGRRTRTKGIKAIQEDVRVNAALWQITEHFASLKGA